MARGKDHKRRLMGAAVVVALALCWSSTAWACAVFRGKMMLAGNAGSGVVTVIGSNTDNNGSNDGLCPSYPLGKAKATRGGSVTVTVKPAGPGACVPADSRLPEGNYDVNYTNGDAYSRSGPTDKSNSDFSRRWRISCISHRGPIPLIELSDYERIGGLFVNGFGKATGTFAVPTAGVANGPTDESAICVSDPGGNNGLQAPLTIL